MNSSDLILTRPLVGRGDFSSDLILTRPLVGRGDLPIVILGELIFLNREISMS